MNHTRRIKIFIGAMVVAAVVAGGCAGFASHAYHGYLGLAVLALAATTSRMKVKLPGIDGNMSVNLPFLLTAVVNLSAVETIVIACVATAVQCWPKNNAKFNLQQMTFNISMMVFATSLASLVFRSEGLLRTQFSFIAMGLVLPTATLFFGQTAPVAGVVAVSERKAAGSIWWSLAHLSFPYYILSIGVTLMVQEMSSHLGWVLVLTVFPIMYGIHRSYQIYFGRVAETLGPQVMVRAVGTRA